METQDSNGSNNGGIHSKFQERLRKIKLNRLKKQQQNKQFINDKLEEIKKEAGQIKKGYVIVSKNFNIKDNELKEVILDIRNTASDRNYNKKKAGFNEAVVKTNGVVIDNIKVKKSTNDIDKKESNINKKDNNIVVNKDLEEKRLYIKENKPIINRNRKAIDIAGDIKNISDNKREKILKDKSIEIIKKLKISFEDKIDELEVLSSELYLLADRQNREIELKKIEDIKKKINELVKRINEIIAQYNLYKKNYYLDNILDIDDNILVDDIIDYKELLDNLDAEKRFVKEYKKLDEFKSLYNNLVNIKEETEQLQISNEEKIKEYGVRDKKYDDIKLGIVSVLDIDKKCSLEIKRQNEYFDNLMKDVNKINKQEYITSHLRGIGTLIGQSFRYMGLLLLSPLAGIMPGIAMQTLATKRMIGNAYKALHVEDVKHIKYQAIDYGYEINRQMCDVEYTEKLIDDTLDDIENLKKDFMLIYNSSIPGYEDTLSNIDKITDKLIHNQKRVSIMKRNLNKSKKINNDKLSLVRKLNDEQK